MHTLAAALSYYQEVSSFFSVFAGSILLVFNLSQSRWTDPPEKKWHFLAYSLKVGKVYLALVSRWKMYWLAHFYRRCRQQITDVSVRAKLDSGHTPSPAICTLVMFSLVFVGKKVCSYIVCPHANLSPPSPSNFWNHWPTLSKFARETEVWKVWSSSKLYEDP